MQAIGALFEAQQAGRSIPGDLLLCGYDGIGWTQRLSPTITTIRQDWPVGGEPSAAGAYIRARESA